MKARRIRSVRGRKVYGYVKRRPAKKGIISLLFFCLAVLIIVLLLMASYTSKGTSGAVIGAYGLIAQLLSAFGIWFAKESYHEPNRAYGVSHAGVILNTLLVTILAAVFIAGML